MLNNIDLEAILFIHFFSLKEEKEKIYSDKCKHNSIYIFKNNDDFRNYFISNGLEDIKDEILDICKMKITSKGTIIALKKICDYTITQSLNNNNYKKMYLKY